MIITITIINGSTVHCWALGTFTVSSYTRKTVGLLGRGISPSQGLYQHRTTQTEKMHINISNGIWADDLIVGKGEGSSWISPRGHCVRRNLITRSKISVCDLRTVNERQWPCGLTVKFLLFVSYAAKFHRFHIILRSERISKVHCNNIMGSFFHSRILTTFSVTQNIQHPMTE